MEQYMQIKNKYKYAILFYRLGDFYEMFFDDAIIASKELEITLTQKNIGNNEKAPMCGVPYHAADHYIAKLINNGFKVAVCEQTEDPKAAKGIVKREVIRVITPGTVMETDALKEDKNNYIMCIFKNKTGFGVSTCDITTGEYVATEFEANGWSKVIDEIAKFLPAEIICNRLVDDEAIKQIENVFYIRPTYSREYNFDLQSADISLCNHFGVLNLSGLGFENKICAITAAGALLAYIKEAQKNGLENIRTLKYYSRSDGMVLDISSRRNLEITANLRDGQKRGSLLEVVDYTKTPMGSRLLRNRLEQPLTNTDEINRRLDAVSEMKDSAYERSALREQLKNVLDIERVMGRVLYGSAGSREMSSLRSSLAALPKIKEIISDFRSELIKETAAQFDELSDIYKLLCDSFADDMPQGKKIDGIIRDGFDAEIDKLRLAKNNGARWLVEMETAEREKTGIKTLRIRYNRVHGYYIEVSNSYLSQVPDSYIRRQTLTTGERFINPELKELEETLLSADEKLAEREEKLFAEIKQKIAAHYARIMKTAALVAETDFIQSLGTAAEKNNYNRPTVSDSDEIKITNGRHPVVERQDNCQYIPNNTYMNTSDTMVSVITGPNMAGKSTYMRQVALIVLMAQVGCLVPADCAEIGVVDRIFTRVGASDDLATGQSTFMVEMVEVANILNNATPKSLLVLDEIGRGTSTFDGMSIAWAVTEYIAKIIKARTMFSTHYQELTSLAEKTDGIKNFCVSVMEKGDNVVFLRKINEGSADKSYGIHVAKLAGVPAPVVKRAGEVLNILGDSGITMMTDEQGVYIDMADFDSEKAAKDAEIVDYIKSLDPDEISPKQAWTILSSIRIKINENT